MPMVKVPLTARQIGQRRRRAHERVVSRLTAGSKKVKVARKMSNTTKRLLANKKRLADERILVTDQKDPRHNGVYTRAKRGKGSVVPGIEIPPAGSLLMESLASYETSFRTKHNDALEADAARDSAMNKAFHEHVSKQLGVAMARGAAGGKKYWWNPKLVTDDKLRFLADECRRKGQYADAAVYYFMLDARGAGI